MLVTVAEIHVRVLSVVEVYIQWCSCPVLRAVRKTRGPALLRHSAWRVERQVDGSKGCWRRVGRGGSPPAQGAGKADGSLRAHCAPVPF